MLQLPESLADFRPATTKEVQSWSYGAVTGVRKASNNTLISKRNTLDDQRTFGPLRDFQCACGKYQDKKYQGMICDHCGVKITTTDARRTRFGHINLSVAIAHPFGTPSTILEALPILPAAFWESPRGGDLAALYEDLVRANKREIGRQILGAFQQVLQLLTPVAVTARAWDLRESSILTQGLALTPGN